GLAVFAINATTTPSYLRLCLPLLVAGVGVSMALPTTASAAVGAVPPAEIGTASGVANTLQRLGGAFGIAVITTVFARDGHLGTPASFGAGFGPAIAVAALLPMAGSAVALATNRRRVSTASPAVAAAAAAPPAMAPVSG